MFLKQSTAYTFRLGPFVDATDGDTEENSLTIAASSVLLSKAGGALTAKNEATALTGTGANGHYTCPLDTTDTGTVGTLRVWAHIAGALPVWKDFFVLPADFYVLLTGSKVGTFVTSLAADVAAVQSDVSTIATDTGITIPGLIGTPVADLATDLAGVQADTDDIQTRLPAALTGAGNMKADALRINGDATAAANLASSADVIYVGSVTGAASSTTLIDSALTQADADFWKGRIIIFLTGTLKYQATDITAFDPATDKLTFTALTNAPSGGDTYVIL